MTVALAGSGVSDFKNVVTSSLTHSRMARASAGLSGSWLASMKAKVQRAVKKKPPPGRGDGFRLALSVDPSPKRKGHAAMLAAVG
jgi:hypothetical protein